MRQWGTFIASVAGQAAIVAMAYGWHPVITIFAAFVFVVSLLILIARTLISTNPESWTGSTTQRTVQDHMRWPRSPDPNDRFYGGTE